MKKIFIPIILILVIISTAILIKRKDENNSLKKLKVAEVTHSIFYAPQYLADSLGYFKDEGLDVEFILTPGADKVTASVLSGDVDIGFCGSEATIYVYKNGEKDYLVNFAGLTKRDGSFLVSREKIKNFKVNDLKGKHVIAGRKAGMPAMTLEYAINKNGLKTTDMNFDTSYDFSATTGAFIGGNGDFVALFEPTATSLVNQGYGYIVASVGKLGGDVPYTAYNAKKSYIDKHLKELKGFKKAINKALDYIHKNSAHDVALKISSYFPDSSINDLEKMVQNYMDIDAWYDTTYIDKKDFEHIEEIIKNAKELDKFVDYNKLVKNI
ncbi:MAG: ABC transporter substrate-binding protein [Bacilli bacterium]|nr:ABC transporter substrate-binding protein [Bacilli bacterium]